jgi:hypothetical protein
MEINIVVPVTENKGFISIEKDVQNLLDEIVLFVGEEKISLVNILSVCVHLMKIVEKYPKLKGPQKKDLVIKALNIYISKNEGDAGILVLVPSFIDTAINIEKGRLEISISPEQVAGCCASFVLSCLKEKK